MAPNGPRIGLGYVPLLGSGTPVVRVTAVRFVHLCYFPAESLGTGLDYCRDSIDSVVHACQKPRHKWELESGLDE